MNIACTHLISQPWAITEQGLEIVKGAALQAEQQEALLTRNGSRPQGTELTILRGETAIINVIGPIFHYENVLTWIFGFPSSDKLIQEIQKAIENPKAQKVVLNIDSPGGQIGGVSELSKFIKYQVKKPVTAYVGDLAASAGYWLASAADEIVAADTAEVGSIGVVFSMLQRSDNTLETVSSLSPKKRPNPATDEGRKQIQARADALAEVFVEAVMENRGLSRDRVLSLQGDVAIAARGIRLGLVDRIGSLESLLTGQGHGQSAYSGASASMQGSPLTADAQARSGGGPGFVEQNFGPQAGHGTGHPLLADAQARQETEAVCDEGQGKSPLLKNAEARR